MMSIISEENFEDQILSIPDILHDIRTLVHKTQLIVQTDSGKSRLLLLKFKWDIEFLKESLDSCLDTNQFLMENDVLAREIAPANSECFVCYCPGEDLIGLACNHLVCRDCWKHYLKDQFEMGRSLIGCLGLDCKLNIDMLTFEHIDVALLPLYEKLLVKDYVESIPSLKFCPGPNCDKVIRRHAYLSDSTAIVCSCSHQFCFQCENAVHAPAKCHQIRRWQANCIKIERHILKQNIDHESYDWVLSNTKECPNCCTAIEKNNGCNHMKCKYRKCGFEFCWQCMKEWREHLDSFTCTNPAETNDSRSNTRTLISYYNAFKKEEKLISREKELLETVTTLKFPSSFKIELTSAIEMVVECRQTLMYSHVFEFYMQRCYYQHRLIDIRKGLETSIEDLSKLIKEGLVLRHRDHYELKIKSRIWRAQRQQKEFLDYCSKGGQYENMEGNGDPESLKIEETSEIRQNFIARRRRRCMILSILIFLILCIFFGLVLFCL